LYIKNKKKIEKKLNVLKKKMKIINNYNIDSNILNNHISINFLHRKKNSIKLKPINFIFDFSSKNIIKLILNRYKKIVETDVKTIIHLHKIISDNLKHYRENFYIKPWKSLIRHGTYKKRNKSYYLNIKKIDKIIFLEIIDLLVSIIRDNDIIY